MRSALIVFLLLLLAGFGAWFLLFDGASVPPTQEDVSDSVQIDQDNAELSSTQTEAAAVKREAVDNPNTALPSSAMTAENQGQGFQALVLHGEDLQAVANAVVAVYPLRLNEEKQWRSSVWLHELDSPQAPQPLFLLQTDSSGRVELPLPMEHYGITASTDDSFGIRVLTTQEPTSTHDVLLWPDRKLEILVQDQQGNPLQGIPVGPLQCGVDGIRFLGEKQTDARGLATFLHLGASLRQFKSSPMLSAATTLPWNIQQPTPVPLARLPERITLTSPATHSVVVKLLNSKGQPFLEPCEVTLKTLHQGFTRELLGPTPPPIYSPLSLISKNGEVVFEQIGTELDLLVQCKFGKTRLYVETIIRGPRASELETTVRLQEETGSVMFPLRILDHDLQPIVNANLTVEFKCWGERKHGESSWQEITTDAQGGLRWGMGAGGLVHDDRALNGRSITIERPRTKQNPPASFTLDLFQAFDEGEQASQDIVLIEQGILRTGTVISPAGIPVADASVQYFLRAGGDGFLGDMWFDEGRAVLTDSQGNFTIYGDITEHQSRLTASHPDFIDAVVELDPKSKEPLVLQLKNSFLVAGRVLLDGHIPWQAINLQILGKTENGRPFQNFNALKDDGRFSYSTDNTLPVQIRLTTGNLQEQIVWESADVMPLPKAEIASQAYSVIDLRGQIHEYELYVQSQNDGLPLAASVAGFSPKGARVHLGACYLGTFTMLGNGDEVELEITAPEYIGQSLALKPGQRTDLELSKGVEVHFQLTPAPTLPDDIFLVLSLHALGSDQKLPLTETTFDCSGSLTTMVSAYGKLRPSVGIMLKSKRMRMTTGLPGMDASWDAAEFTLKEGVTSAPIQISIDIKVVEEAIERMSDLRDRKKE